MYGMTFGKIFLKSVLEKLLVERADSLESPMYFFFLQSL